MKRLMCGNHLSHAMAGGWRHRRERLNGCSARAPVPSPQVRGLDPPGTHPIFETEVGQEPKRDSRTSRPLR